MHSEHTSGDEQLKQNGTEQSTGSKTIENTGELITAVTELSQTLNSITCDLLFDNTFCVYASQSILHRKAFVYKTDVLPIYLSREIIC